jgi:AraC family ethanolamine operon transcriptional activator
MESPELPQLVLDQNFSDFDDFSDNIEWELEFRQLDAGALKVHAGVLGSPRTVVMRNEISRACHQAGQPPPKMLTFGLPDSDAGEFRWCGRDVRGGDLLNFNLDSGFEGVTSAGFVGFAVSFKETLLQEVSEAMELNFDYRDKLSATEVWSDADRTTGQLRHRLIAAFNTAGNFNGADTLELFNCSAAATLLEFLSDQSVSETRLPVSFRNRALRMTMEWLEETDELPLTVMELCQKTGFSAPTLYRAFMEEFGLGPKRYLHVRRLAGVRHELMSRRAEESISDVAIRWGFWHMGKFAADYKMQFGELPSETRANR